MNSHQEVLHGNSSVDYSVKARKGYQFSSFTQSCPTLCNPIDCRTPGFPVHHQLLELAQTHVHQLVMLSNHLILFRIFLLPRFNLSQHQGLFK